MSRALSLILLAAFLPSCAYLNDRVRDLDECFLIEIGTGLPIAADVKVGPLDVGAGMAWGQFAGKPTWWKWSRRHGVINGGLPPLFHFLMKSDAEGEDLRLSLLALTEPWQVLMWCREEDREAAVAETYEGFKKRKPEFYTLGVSRAAVDAFGVEAGACALVGLRVGVNVAEVADFLVGWFGLELTGDLRWDARKLGRRPGLTLVMAPPSRGDAGKKAP